MRDQFILLFRELDRRIEELNQIRLRDGLFALPKAKVRLLGQISLMVHEEAAAILDLTQTIDVDGMLSMDHSIKTELRSLLTSHGYVYDEDSVLIWIPEGAEFLPFVELENIIVESLDPESALVSKAVKAPEKNRHLIRQAIASNAFPTLVDRILKSGGKLEELI